ncbi:hypothetical protein [Fibrella forsythiae]|uniref:Uncharacterized protein n=1 Tax=Fibrella forsythiae TaxID=2817061 RepID=A0ABS3JM48_9BACT|nr:hypothetical protein [Fibrella forsythiae]MBO0950476.1 hypothetical protein [Fibrella forsythiae]
MENPFKLIEPEVNCPPHLKEQIVSEIDLIRNALKVVELYSGDLFGSISAMLTPKAGSNFPKV